LLIAKFCQEFTEDLEQPIPAESVGCLEPEFAADVKTKPGDGYRNIQHNSFVVFLCRFSPKAETEVNGTAMYGRQLRLRKG